MLVTKPAYFDRFACLAGDCPDTCCGAWQVIIDEKSLALYRSVGGGLGEKIRGALLAEAGETRFAMERGRCRLLTLGRLLACPGTGYGILRILYRESRSFIIEFTEDLTLFHSISNLYLQGLHNT